VAGLRQGQRVEGVVLAVSHTTARLFKPPAAAGAIKRLDQPNAFCDVAGIVRSSENGAIGLVGLFGDGTARSFAIPSLKGIASVRLDGGGGGCDGKGAGAGAAAGAGAGALVRPTSYAGLSRSVITPSGDVYIWTGPSEVAVVNPWGAGIELYVPSADPLFLLFCSTCSSLSAT
jgi:syntaxin-binding protein 5